MSTPPAHPINRLILLVLCLNLICLALLVYRAFQPPPPPERFSTVVETTAPSVESSVEPAPVAPRPIPVSVAKRAAVPTPAPVAVVESKAPEETFTSPDVVPTVPAPLVNVGNTRLGQSGGNLATVAQARGELAGLSGRVILQGTPKPEIPIDLGPVCSSISRRPGPVTTRHFVVGPEGGLANVLVSLEMPAAAAPPELNPPALDNKGCMFEPYVLGLVVGQKLAVFNLDSTFHNVHFTPRLNRELNYALVARSSSVTVTFAKPEAFVRVKCDVHPWMFAYVSVMAHPYFAVTDTNGFFQIPFGIPSGHHKLEAAHLKAGSVRRDVDLRAGENQEVELVLSTPDRGQAAR